MKKYQVLLSFILIFSAVAKAQTGIFSELEKNQKKILTNYQRVLSKAKNLPLTSIPDLKLEDLNLSSEYLAWVFMNSDPSYVTLFRPKDLCRFTEMASNKLLKPTELIVFSLAGKNDIKEETPKNRYGHFKLDQFITFLEKNNKCPNLKANRESFNNKNITTTISSYQLKKPSSENECDDTIEQIINDKMSPSFCGIAREIKDADLAIVELDIKALTIGAKRKNELNRVINRGAYIRDKIGNLNASLMSQICQNLNQSENFCAPHLREDIWTRSMSGEIPPKKISTICSQLTKNNQMNKRVLERCASIANDMPNSCIDIQLAKKTALFPVQNCDQLSKDLLASNVIADYKDCPSKIENHSMINLQRIGSQVKGIHEKYKNNSCEEIPAKVYSNISYQYDSDNWPLKICYFDPADADDLKICYKEGYEKKCLTYDPDAPLSHHQSSKSVLENILKTKFNDGLNVNCAFFEVSEKDKYLYGSAENCLVFHKKNNCDLLKCPKTVLLNRREIKEINFSERELRCLPYIPGNDTENEIAENKTVAKIIKRIYAAPNSTTCKIISEKDYNPIFLEYKQGCFVLTPNNCQASNCKKRIIYNQKEFFNFSYRGELGENYFQVSTKDKGHSSNRKIKKVLGLEDEKILSLTKIKSWFKESKSIIHGISCLEDLYPMFYQRKSFNQCEAIPFIISGVKTLNEREYVVIQTTLDSINYPRTIRWNSLYNSLKMYQLIHPQKVWALYGIK